MDKFEVTVQKSELGNIQSSLDYFLKFNIPLDAKILDVGCNFGSLIFNLYQNGYKNIYGVDVNRNAIEHGRTRYTAIVDRLETQEFGVLSFPDESFDVVLMFDVIEHIPSVERFLGDEVYRVLKKDGLLIFQTPNRYTNIPWEIIQQKSLTGWKRYHCSLQTLGSLRRILEKAYFSQITLEKNDILTDHNKNKVRNKLGAFGIATLYILQTLPLWMYPNFWGISKKV